MISRLDHFTIVTDNLAKTEEFYSKFLGFSVGPRPDFKIPGIWLYANEVPILHVVGVEEMPNPRRGVLDHMAFRGSGMNDLLRKLTDEGVSFRIIPTPAPWNQWQVFFDDPNEAVVEIDFDGEEALDPQFAGAVVG